MEFDLNVNANKLMAGAFNSQLEIIALVMSMGVSYESSVASDQRSFSDSQTVFHLGSLEPGTFGTISRKPQAH